MSIKGRLKKIEKQLEQIFHSKNTPPLFIRPFDDDAILGFRSGDDVVIRRDGESLKELEARSVETLQKEPGALLLTAICKDWDDRLYNPPIPEEEWCQDAHAYYNSEKWRGFYE